MSAAIAIGKSLEGATPRQKNPYHRTRLATSHGSLPASVVGTVTENHQDPKQWPEDGKTYSS